MRSHSFTPGQKPVGPRPVKAGGIREHRRFDIRMASELLTFATRVLSRWQNGAGRKADIASSPGWMVGFAWLDEDAPFSDFSGQDRTITLLDGPGFTLDFAPPRPALVVRSRHEPSRFDGGWPTRCGILGPCLVLNAMTVRGQWRHDLDILTAPARLPSPPAGAVAFLVDLTTHDALRLDGEIQTDGLPAAHILFTPEVS
jgi:environmental stress-induced protein Ves